MMHSMRSMFLPRENNGTAGLSLLTPSVDGEPPFTDESDDMI